METSFDYIFKKRDSSSKLSLDRIKLLLNYLDNPHDHLKFIHIAGTKGKGSITTMLSNVLVNSNLKVGKYISPYVDNFYERIQINNTYISESIASNLLNKIKPFIDQMEDKPTPFEILCALAFLYFYEENCDIVCLEVGLGGRFDATNVINNTLISIISIIDYDHMDYLGNTIEEIAFEKCGIIKPNKITISYPNQRIDANLMIDAMSKIRNNKLINIDLDDLLDIKKIAFNYSFIYQDNYYELGLNGKHQIYNALVVIEAIKNLRLLGFNIPQNILFEALKNTKFIGRLDLINENPYVFLDGAHNEISALALREFILDNKEDRNIILITGMIEGKDHEAFFKTLKGCGDHIILTKIEDPIKKSADINTLENIIKKYFNSYEVILNHQEAYQKSLSLAKEKDIIIITGSLYLISEFYNGII